MALLDPEGDPNPLQEGLLITDTPAMKKKHPLLGMANEFPPMSGMNDGGGIPPLKGEY